MRLLLEIRDSDIFSGAQDLDSSDFSEKETSRAVITNSFGQIALLHVPRYNYHKLPGGGVEDGEGPLEALRREMLEEMGSEVHIMAEVGKIVEHKNEQRRKQTSYCYLGKQVGDVIPPNFTESELANRYAELWVDDIDSAIDLLRSDQPIGYSREFIRVRELAFLQAAKPLVP